MANEEKDFDAWNIVKKYTDTKADVIGVHEREIWWISMGLNIGVEINGKHQNFERPVLVVKKFNLQMLWILPITSQAKNSRFYEKYMFQEKEYYIALTQLKTVSAKRFLRKAGMVPQEDFKRVIEKLMKFFQTNETPH